jgi:hypothetical protein
MSNALLSLFYRIPKFIIHQMKVLILHGSLESRPNSTEKIITNYLLQLAQEKGLTPVLFDLSAAQIPLLTLPLLRCLILLSKCARSLELQMPISGLLPCTMAA